MESKRNREKLPSNFESKIKNEYLKEQIADVGMWGLIPSVNYSMKSPKGIKRINDNMPLFKFIETYFADDKYAFEPNMLDGRYVFLPANVNHQGIGVCVSEQIPGFLEVCHFWYPCEYTQKKISIGPGQVYVPIYNIEPDEYFAEIIRKIYIDNAITGRKFCTFPFEPGIAVTLKGDFIDDIAGTEKIIKSIVKTDDPITVKTAKALIDFLKRL